MKKVLFIFVSVILLLETTSAVAGNIPTSVPGKSENPKCQTSSNASTTAKSAVTKSTLKACQPGDGLSQGTAGSSAWQIKRDYPGSQSGNYWIKNSAINGGAPFQVYADMNTDGGGWTLIVANSINGWNDSETLLKNQNLPPTNPNNLDSQSGKYSILSYADFLKKSSSGFQYRVDAGEFEKCGGIWTANSNYSFISTSNSNININLDRNWSDWSYEGDGIEQRMPYFAPGAQGLLTTSIDPSNSWWGTLIQSGRWEDPSNPAVVPWISSITSCRTPTIIWYWVR